MMSINDPLVTEYTERHGYWIVKQGRETFFDPDTREILTFSTEQQALDWIKRKEESKNDGR